MKKSIFLFIITIILGIFSFNFVNSEKSIISDDNIVSGHYSMSECNDFRDENNNNDNPDYKKFERSECYEYNGSFQYNLCDKGEECPSKYIYEENNNYDNSYKLDNERIIKNECSNIEISYKGKNGTVKDLFGKKIEKIIKNIKGIDTKENSISKITKVKDIFINIGNNEKFKKNQTIKDIICYVKNELDNEVAILDKKIKKEKENELLAEYFCEVSKQGKYSAENVCTYKDSKFKTMSKCLAEKQGITIIKNSNSCNNIVYDKGIFKYGNKIYWSNGDKNIGKSIFCERKDLYTISSRKNLKPKEVLPQGSRYIGVCKSPKNLKYEKGIFQVPGNKYFYSDGEKNFCNLSSKPNNATKKDTIPYGMIYDGSCSKVDYFEEKLFYNAWCKDSKISSNNGETVKQLFNGCGWEPNGKIYKDGEKINGFFCVSREKNFGNEACKSNSTSNNTKLVTKILSEKSSSKTCGGYYKTYGRYQGDKMTSLFISNGNCRDVNKEFPYLPKGGLKEECIKHGGNGNYTWKYHNNGTTTGVSCEINNPKNIISDNNKCGNNNGKTLELLLGISSYNNSDYCEKGEFSNLKNNGNKNYTWKCGDVSCESNISNEVSKSLGNIKYFENVTQDDVIVKCTNKGGKILKTESIENTVFNVGSPTYNKLACTYQNSLKSEFNTSTSTPDSEDNSCEDTNPVCGLKNRYFKTYDNKCEAEKDGIKTIFDGKCNERFQKKGRFKVQINGSFNGRYFYSNGDSAFCENIDNINKKLTIDRTSIIPQGMRFDGVCQGQSNNSNGTDSNNTDEDIETKKFEIGNVSRGYSDEEEEKYCKDNGYEKVSYTAGAIIGGSEGGIMNYAIICERKKKSNGTDSNNTDEDIETKKFYNPKYRGKTIGGGTSTSDQFCKENGYNKGGIAILGETEGGIAGGSNVYSYENGIWKETSSSKITSIECMKEKNSYNDTSPIGDNNNSNKVDKSLGNVKKFTNVKNKDLSSVCTNKGGKILTSQSEEKMTSGGIFGGSAGEEMRNNEIAYYTLACTYPDNFKSKFVDIETKKFSRPKHGNKYINIRSGYPLGSGDAYCRDNGYNKVKLRADGGEDVSSFTVTPAPAERDNGKPLEVAHYNGSSWTTIGIRSGSVYAYIICERNIGGDSNKIPKNNSCGGTKPYGAGVFLSKNEQNGEHTEWEHNAQTRENWYCAWKCEEGYERNGNSCIRKIVSDNSCGGTMPVGAGVFLSKNEKNGEHTEWEHNAQTRENWNCAWKCKDGYERNGNSCKKQNVKCNFNNKTDWKQPNGSSVNSLKPGNYNFRYKGGNYYNININNSCKWITGKIKSSLGCHFKTDKWKGNRGFISRLTVGKHLLRYNGGNYYNITIDNSCNWTTGKVESSLGCYFKTNNWKGVNGKRIKTGDSIFKYKTGHTYKVNINSSCEWKTLKKIK